MDVEVAVRDVPERNRYEAIVADTVAGFIEYRVADGDRAFMHTEVSDEFEGKVSAARWPGGRWTTYAPGTSSCGRSAPSCRAGSAATRTTPRWSPRSTATG
jgi:hypothetical protein